MSNWLKRLFSRGTPSGVNPEPSNNNREEPSMHHPRAVTYDVAGGKGVQVWMPRSPAVPDAVTAWHAMFVSPIAYGDTEEQWRKWFYLKKRHYRELATMLRDEQVKDAFKARIIDIFISVSRTTSPYGDNVDRSLGEWRPDVMDPLTWLGHELGLPSLSRDVARHLAARIGWSIDWIWGRGSEYSESMFWDCAQGLNQCIISALCVLEEDDPYAAALFERFQINDMTVFAGLEDASGYNPLSHLLWSQAPESWKRKACDQMHQVIVSEVYGGAKPRADHEEAFKCYRYMLNMVGIPMVGRTRDRESLTKKFVADEMQFLLTHSAPDRLPVDSYRLDDALHFLSGEEWRDLRVGLTCSIAQAGLLSIHDPQEIQIMRIAALECEEQYPDVAAAVRHACDVAESHIQVAQEARRKETLRESQARDALRS